MPKPWTFLFRTKYYDIYYGIDMAMGVPATTDPLVAHMYSNVGGTSEDLYLAWREAKVFLEGMPISDRTDLQVLPYFTADSSPERFDGDIMWEDITDPIIMMEIRDFNEETELIRRLAG